ncbi:MAG: DNA translocase FtsK 4TM domain-containing protein, partial [Candidatus Delongbacteria bacterium]|nr:DNA translocase FtsK 4TM domain-containing protein [Candidatus Delongbacteria bacterium]MCG2761264.1 DNA translocase FtsK 4TM domain-containing protein [Candidatus Delongbacteria bacterium]
MKITREKLHDIFGVVFLAIGLIILIGLLSKESIGKFGGMVQLVYSMTFGDKISFTIPLFFFIEGYFFIKTKPPLKHAKNFIIFFILSAVLSSSVGVYQYGKNSEYFNIEEHSYGNLMGSIGFYGSKYFIEYLGYAGSVISLTALFVIILMFVFDFRVMQMLHFISYPFVRTFKLIIRLYSAFRKYLARKRFEKELRKKQE